ncbi:MAG: restriction endonuclease [Phycisphaerales bacterium]|nr:restriction endonuclease [Phycisphaerales bacterium]
MALWLVRTGKHGEHEEKFLLSRELYICWTGLNHDLSKLKEQRELYELLCSLYPSNKSAKNRNHSGQLWPFAHGMKEGDWVVVPSKRKPAIHIAEIQGPYVFDPSAPDPYYHHRKVKWVAQDIPRSVFDQDLLYSFGAFMTICEIQRNNAEERVRAIVGGSWKQATPSTRTEVSTPADKSADLEADVDLERLGRDRIAKAIIAQYKGHGLARLVDAILRAQGYSTYVSSAGPDKGVDLLAAPGPLGFGNPRLCVQVKSGDAPVDTATLNQLIGAMQNVQADQGLLVAWGGFKSLVEKEERTQFFRVRLWNQDQLIEELLAHYDKLDADIRAELPLKRMWTVAQQDDEE